MRSELDRFQDKIEKIPWTGCWLWTGTTYRKGYGHFRRKLDGKWVMFKCHRYSYEVFKGAIPDGLNVLHTCDITCCVNPDHLFLGTLADNNADTKAKGRKRFGRNPKHKHLSKDFADKLRFIWGNLPPEDGWTQKKFADAFGISTSQMSRILLNQIWK